MFNVHKKISSTTEVYFIPEEAMRGVSSDNVWAEENNNVDGGMKMNYYWKSEPLNKSSSSSSDL